MADTRSEVAITSIKSFPPALATIISKSHVVEMILHGYELFPEKQREDLVGEDLIKV